MTPMIFARHAGTMLAKYLGIKHDKVGYDKNYTYVEVPGKVIYRDDPEEGDLMVMRAEEDVVVKSRAIIQVNPELFKAGIVNCNNIVEPGEVPTVFLRGYDGFYEELELAWLYRVYFIR